MLTEKENGFVLKINHLENCFNKAKEVGANYIAVKIRMVGFPQDEIIVNPIENADSKLAYYKGAYDENLVHQWNRNISIVGFTYGKSFMDIEYDLVEVPEFR